MKFEETPEYKQMLKMLPACNKVIMEAFGVKNEDINRFDKDSDLFILDREFHIDLIVTLPNKSQLTGQEKALSFDKSTFRTFTMEFYQDRFTKQKGEFFKIASQFYLHGYSDKTGINFKEWVIIDILKFINWLKKIPLKKLESQTRPSTSKASFFYLKYDLIPSKFILYKSK